MGDPLTPGVLAAGSSASQHLEAAGPFLIGSSACHTALPAPVQPYPGGADTQGAGSISGHPSCMDLMASVATNRSLMHIRPHAGELDCTQEQANVLGYHPITDQECPTDLDNEEEEEDGSEEEVIAGGDELAEYERVMDDTVIAGDDQFEEEEAGGDYGDDELGDDEYSGDECENSPLQPTMQEFAVGYVSADDRL
ncbi:hypothetical protein EJB05_17828, partial [Eragrostis curvula]